MTTSIGIGFSRNADASMAAQEAAEQAKEQLNQKRIDLGILFNTAHYDPKECLPVVHKALDETRVIGASTAGIIFSNRVETQGIGIIAVYSEEIVFETSHVAHLDLQDMRSAGRTLVKDAMTDFGQRHRKLLVFFADGLLHDTSTLIDGIKEQLGGAFPIIGAGSSDDLHFHKTYQYFQEKPLTKSIVSLLLGGRFEMGISCRHGWRPLGKPRTVDRTEKHIIKSINGKKAMDIYREYFGEEAETLKAGSLGHINVRYPLGTKMNGKNEYLVRNVVGAMDDGSILCRNNIDEGTDIHIMIGNKDSCLQAAGEAAADVKDQLQGQPPKLVLVFESFLRHKLLGRDILKEMEVIKKVFGPAPLFGMYSYGEFLNFSSSKDIIQTQSQDGSIIILAIS